MSDDEALLAVAVVTAYLMTTMGAATTPAPAGQRDEASTASAPAPAFCTCSVFFHAFTRFICLVRWRFSSLRLVGGRELVLLADSRIPYLSCGSLLQAMLVSLFARPIIGTHVCCRPHVHIDELAAAARPSIQP
jgi:hypothetical protein